MTQTEEQPAGSFPDTPLTARLFRRISEPLGVIDVRHPEYLQARSTAANVQRLELLNQWKTRYGLTAPSAPVERASAALAQPFVMRSPLPSLDGMPEFQPAQQLRVKRPFEVRTADAPLVKSSADHSTVPSANNEAVTEASFPVPNDRTELLRASETVAAPAVSGPQISRQAEQRKKDAESPTTTSEVTVFPDRSGDMVLQQPHSFQTAVPVSPSGTSAPAASPLPVTATPVFSQTGELMLRRKVKEQWLPAASTGSRDSGSEPLVTRSTPITPLPPSGSLAHKITARASSPAPIFLARKTYKTERLAGSGPTAAPEPTPNVAATAQEISAAPSVLGTSSIVWRRADSTASPSSRALPPPISASPGAQIMRAPASSSSGLPGTTLQSAVTAPASHAGVDVEHLAERVSRVIARQLTVERERRGMFR